MVPFDAVKMEEFMQAFKIRNIPGVGKVKEAELNAVGISSINDVFTHLAELWAHDDHESK